MHDQSQSPQIAYVVGAGPYPYRADGRRMSHSEAASYLVWAHAMGALQASRLLDMVATQAVRDAGAPRVESGAEQETYRIQGSDPLPRGQACRDLVQQWRLTPAEAATALDRAVGGDHTGDIHL